MAAALKIVALLFRLDFTVMVEVLSRSITSLRGRCPCRQLAESTRCSTLSEWDPLLSVGAMSWFLVLLLFSALKSALPGPMRVRLAWLRQSIVSLWKTQLRTEAVPPTELPFRITFVGLNWAKAKVLMNLLSGMLHRRFIDMVTVKPPTTVWKFVFLPRTLTKTLFSPLLLHLLACRQIPRLLTIVPRAQFPWCVGSPLWPDWTVLPMTTCLMTPLVTMVVPLRVPLDLSILVVLLLLLISVEVRGRDSPELL